MDIVMNEKWLTAIDDACGVCEFKWGVNDCCTWVNSVIAQAINRNFLHECGLKFSSKKQAFEQIKSFGGGDLRLAVHKIASQCDWQTIDPQNATTGCVGLIKSRGQWTLAINRNGLWVCRTRHGVACAPAYSATMVWEIR